MSESLIDKIARAVLYEGYILYPYRPSVKSQQRWTFGGLYPEAWTNAQSTGDPNSMTIECLVEATPAARVNVRVRFLHLLQRTVARLHEPVSMLPAQPTMRRVETLTIEGKTFVSWQEAIERNIESVEYALADLLGPSIHREFAFPASRNLEPLRSADRMIEGVLVREQQPVQGMVECSAIQLEDGLFKLRVIIRNRTDIDLSSERTDESTTQQRDAALMRTLVSTHAILCATNGGFVSLTDPPERLKKHAAECQNVGNWPVLVGEAPAANTLLASPIILYDYPQIAPESPGDLFDGCEIDEILSLRIMTLTDNEKAAAASIDDKAKEMLARTEALAREQLMGLHGTMRGMRSQTFAGSEATSPRALAAWDPFTPLDTETKLNAITLEDGQIVRAGDRVRLRPLARADIFDMVLDGKLATILSIEQDFENRVHLAVGIDDDPGNDLAATGKPGHRFFFGIDEVEVPQLAREGAAR